MRISERVSRIERRRRPRLPVVVRWDAPERVQVDIHTKQPVELGAKVLVVAYLGNQQMWDAI